MPVEIKYGITNATSSNMTDNVDDTIADTEEVDGANSEGETTWTFDDWSKYYGYYLQIPECKISTDTLARWTIGDGYICEDSRTEAILESITGWGTDTFDDILENLDRTMSINGDSFAEIIRDEKSGILLNLKPLDPGAIRVVVNSQGIIKRYEQITNIKEGTSIRFSKNEIFHLSNKRLASNIHGISDYEAIETIIRANFESLSDCSQLMHRYVRPKWIFRLDTDNATQINSFISKMDRVVNEGENIYVPKGSVEAELMAIPSNATLNPLPWREHIKSYFYQVCGIPQILLGGAAEFSESSAKIAYLSWEQTVKMRQRYLITQCWNQLAVRIDLAFPASLQNEMLSDSKKDGQNQQMTAEMNPAGMEE